MTSRAILVQHTATDGPGWLAEWLPAAGVELDIVRPYAGEPLSGVLETDALVVMGGPMGANDDDVALWLPRTRDLLRATVAAALGPAAGRPGDAMALRHRHRAACGCRLAGGSAACHQGFRVGERAWGLQFHIETPVPMVAGWARNDAGALRAVGLDPAAVVRLLRGGRAGAEQDLAASGGAVCRSRSWAAAFTREADRSRPPAQ